MIFRLSLSVLLMGLVLLSPSYGKTPRTFKQWKKSYALRAAKRGLALNFVKKILDPLEVDASVLQRDRTQLLTDKRMDYLEFIKKWLRTNPSRIELGRQMLAEHRELLEKIEQKYGVDKEVLVSLWGVETFYGQIMGEFNVIQSLATLAYEGRRRKFFEIQLNAALRLVRDGHVSVENFVGSWAGATGQCQFMPSNIKVYGRDFDGDGKIDIWNNKADVFASMAYLLQKAGWKRKKSIGSLALNLKNKTLSTDRTWAQESFNQWGFRNLDKTLIKDPRWARRKVAFIPMKNAPVVLRGSNYQALRKWNNSALFAAFTILLVNGF